MSKVVKWKAYEEVARDVARGSVAVIPTDTIYGIVASVACPEAVERLYKLRNRDRKKSCIVLISSYEVLRNVLSEQDFQKYHDIFSFVWPGPVSVVFPSVKEIALPGISRQEGSLAFRVPNDDYLRAFLEISGPIVAPSANRQGELPATTIEEAQRYFAHDVDVYLKGEILEGSPSTLIRLEKNDIVILREGIIGADRIKQVFGKKYRIIPLSQ